MDFYFTRKKPVKRTNIILYIYIFIPVFVMLIDSPVNILLYTYNICARSYDGWGGGERLS